MFKEKVVNDYCRILSSTNLDKKDAEISNQMCLNSILVKMGRKVKSTTDPDTDYGAQKTCTKCGNVVEEFMPETIKKVVSYWPKYVHPKKSTPDYKEEEVGGWKCPECGLLSDDQVRGESVVHNNLDMDDLRRVFSTGKGKKAYHHNHKLIEGNWLKENAKVLKKLYHYVDANGEDPETGKRVSTKASFNEILYDREDTDMVGVSCEDKTHESYERLSFWKEMCWLIGHCPERAYDKAISKMYNDPNEDIIQDDELEWLNHVTGGVRNPGMVRYACFRMMETKKYFKNNPMKFIPVKPPKFENFNYKEEKARVEKYGTIQVLEADYYGRHIVIRKGKTATDWLTNLDNIVLNEFLTWARTQYKKQ
jgi:hypothetical protein